MVLGKHTKNESGRIRKERSDSLLGTLAKDYPELKQFNPRMQLGTLEKKLKTDSLSGVRKNLKNNKK